MPLLLQFDLPHNPFGLRGGIREHGALHHLIRSDQRLFGFSEGTGAAINVGSAYRLFLGIVPLRGSSTEGLSGQFTIGATDSYNARVHEAGPESNRIRGKFPVIA